MKAHPKTPAFVIVVLSLYIVACRKDISVPARDLEKLFGHWEWVQSSGGFVSQTRTPASLGYSKAIDFNKNGICKIYKDGKRMEKRKFTLSTGNTIYSNDPAYLIAYTGAGLREKEYSLLTQSVRFGGQDTLMLFDECNDCFVHVYTRKK